jgi:tetratricopeptide (TPR) repeat protein
MLPKLIVRLITIVFLFALAFEAIDAESPGPGAEGQSIGDRRASSPSPSALAYFNRGVANSRLGNTDKAIADYTSAIQLDPRYTRAYINRGSEYSNKRNYKLALRDETIAIQLDPKCAAAYHNRGACYADIGEFDKAIADYSQAIRFDPGSAITFRNRGSVYEQLEQFGKAIADYDRVIRITPKHGNGYEDRGYAYSARGNYRQAASDFGKSVRLSPNYIPALANLAWLKATCPDASLRNGNEAIRLSIKACELSKWKKPACIFALAAAYAETGDFDQAVKYQMQGIRMKSAYSPDDRDDRERLALYRDHKPYRNKPLVTR